MNGKLVHGAGVYSKGKYLGSIKQVSTREYRLWNGMLERCYSPSRKRLLPTYLNCTVSENFKNFQFFAEWCNNQVGWDKVGWELDKDILAHEAKSYSEDTCCFVPKELNMILTQHNGARGIYPIGVYFVKRCGKFAAQIRLNGNKVGLGYFNTAKEAFDVYKEAKECQVKVITHKFKDDLDSRVFKSLMDWKVDINV